MEKKRLNSKKVAKRATALLTAVVLMLGILPVQTVPVKAAPVMGAVASKAEKITKISTDDKSDPGFAFTIRPEEQSKITPKTGYDIWKCIPVAILAGFFSIFARNRIKRSKKETEKKEQKN